MIRTRWFFLLAPACVALASCQSGPIPKGPVGPLGGPAQVTTESAPEFSKGKLDAPGLAKQNSTESNLAESNLAESRQPETRRPETERVAPKLAPIVSGKLPDVPETAATPTRPIVRQRELGEENEGKREPEQEQARRFTFSDTSTPLPSPPLDADAENPIQLVAYGSYGPRHRARRVGATESWLCQPTDIYGDFDNWRPPGIMGPWPSDEYICDGGDRLLSVQVDRDWTVRGLDQEDTIAHYETLSGKTIVQPSNRVCIYAPRFAAVRHVAGLMLDEGHQRAAGVSLPTPPISQELREPWNMVTQPVQIERSLAVTPAYAFLDRMPVMGVDNVRALQGIRFDLLPYEDLVALEGGILDASEKARLAEKTIAAKVWETATGLQVVIDNQVAIEAVNDTTPQEVLCYDMPKGKPRLQIIKIASKQNALPGELVEFTLRYDNIGNEEIGNVTIIDSLTTRLEYVEDSARSTRDADFFTAENEGDSLLLRWELKEPLKTGEGGLIRFQTRVR